MNGEALDEGFLGAVDLDRLDAAEHLLDLGEGAAGGGLETHGNALAVAAESAEHRHIEQPEPEAGEDGDLRVDQEEGGDEQDDGGDAGEAVEQWQQHAARVAHHVADDFFHQHAGVFLEEIGVGPAGDLAQQADAQPMAELVGVAGADELGGKVHAIGQKQHDDGKDPGDQQQAAVVHRREELEELGAELGIAQPCGVGGEGEEGKDGGDAKDLEDALGEREAGDDDQLLPAVRRGQGIDLADQVGAGLKEERHLSGKS